MMNTQFFSLLVLILASHSQALYAEETNASAKQDKSAWPQFLAAENLSEDDYIGEVPRVLTVSRLSQSMADVPSAVTVIDRETIRASGIVDLPEIFRLVPGMYVGANAGYFHSTNHAVSYHGMTTAYTGTMQVMINGRSVYSPLFGGVQWSELPLAIADIERIEVTRGPNAASYGANSYFGVINIITQNPAEVSNNRIVATHGNGRNEAFYRHAGKIDDLNYRVTAGYRQDDGLHDRNDFKRTRLLNAQADYQVNTNNSLAFEFGLSDGARGEGDINQDPFIFVPRTKQINNHYELIRWRHNLSDDSDFVLQAFHNYDRSDDRTTSVNLRPVLRSLVLEDRLSRGDSLPLATLIAAAAAAALQNDNILVKNEVVAERYDIEAQHNFSVGKTLRAVWGGSVRRDSMYAPHYLGTNKTDYFDLQRLFGHVEWQAHQKLAFNAGAMIEHNDFTGTDISPRVSINFKLHPNHTFRLGASSALRTPNYVEEKFQRSITVPTVAPTPNILFQYFADKGNLKPEQIVSREIGYLGRVGNFSLDTRIFHDTISDHIRIANRRDFVVPAGFELLNENSVKTGENGGDAAVDGFEAQAKWRFASTTDLLLNFAHVNIRETHGRLTNSFDESMPSNTVSALITHRFDHNWDASFAYYQTSETTQLGDGTNVDLIRRSDVRLARQFNSGRWKGEVSAVVENLFNEHYEEFADYNTLKRRGRINLRLDF
jgi:iron complex outermembrane receptor protein